MADEVERVEGPAGDIDRSRQAVVQKQFDGRYLRMVTLDRHGQTCCSFPLDLKEIRALLLSQGLHIVGEADWAVLEASAKMTGLRDRGDEIDAGELDVYPVLRAELTRRAAKGE